VRSFAFGGTSAYVNDDWKISKAKDSRATFTCTVVDYVPSVDEEVIVSSGGEYLITADGEYFRTADGLALFTTGTPIFAGYVTEASPAREKSSVFYDVTATDYSRIADYRITSFVAYNKTAAQIITDHLLTILTEEGVTLGTIDTGATITKCVMPYKTVAQILDDLVSVSGDYYWTIDMDKKLHFMADTSRDSGITIDANTVINNLKYSKNSEEYRNVQTVVGAATPTAPQTETVVPDGSTYSVRYPIQSQPTITVGGVESTSVGVSGLDSGTDWTWSYQSRDITYNGATPPASIVVTYTGLYSVVARSKNQTEINRKKALAGGSGIKESLHTDSNINSSAQARQYCAALLDKNSKDGETITFSTESADYAVGELVTVKRDEMGIDGQYEVLKMDSSAASADTIKYDVTLTNGTAATWDRFFAALVNKSKAVTIGDDSIATTLKDVSESASVSGSYSIGKYTPLYPSDDLYPSETLYPGGTVEEVATVND